MLGPSPARPEVDHVSLQIALGLVAAAAKLVSAAERRAWQAEWHAELITHVETQRSRGRTVAAYLPYELQGGSLYFRIACVAVAPMESFDATAHISLLLRRRSVAAAMPRGYAWKLSMRYALDRVEPAAQRPVSVEA